jgi:hypothetical protein
VGSKKGQTPSYGDGTVQITLSTYAAKELLQALTAALGGGGAKPKPKPKATPKAGPKATPKASAKPGAKASTKPGAKASTKSKPKK